MHRFYESKRKDIQNKVNLKRSGSFENGDVEKEKKKKQKAVYIVNNKKWYLTANTKELQMLSSMVMNGDDMEIKHRIVQHTIR